MKFIHFKSPIQYLFFVFIFTAVQPSPQSHFRTCLSFQKEIFAHLQSLLNPTSSPRQPQIYFSLYICFVYTFLVNGVIDSNMWAFASCFFHWAQCFWDHPFLACHTSFLFCGIEFHGKHALHFGYLFTNWWVFEFIVFSLLWVMLLWISLYKFNLEPCFHVSWVDP